MTMMNDQDSYIKKAMRKVMQTSDATLTTETRVNRASTAVDHEALSNCLINLAHLIKQGGDAYLPIFERVRQEMKQHDHFRNVKALALQLSEQSVDKDKHH